MTEFLPDRTEWKMLERDIQAMMSASKVKAARISFVI